jgi:hypothetical protein
MFSDEVKLTGQTSIHQPQVRSPEGEGGLKKPASLPLPFTSCAVFRAPSNEPCAQALSMMPERKPTSAGPMSVQPFEHGSTAPTQVSMMPTAAAETKPKKQTPRTEAVRIAKARIMRRNSLRKQRQAQKG